MQHTSICVGASVMLFEAVAMGPESAGQHLDIKPIVCPSLKGCLVVAQDGNTALMVAAAEGQSNTVNTLLRAGASLEATNKVRMPF